MGQDDVGDNKRADIADVGDGRGEASAVACDTGYATLKNLKDALV